MTVNSEIAGPKSMFTLDPAVLINEDTQMCVTGTSGGTDANGPMESPYEFPSHNPGDISSPFETMESDGALDVDDSSCLPPGCAPHQIWSTGSGNFSTTTPRESSDEDRYESSGSRKKRRRTKRDFHPSDNFAQSHLPYYSHSSQVASPVCMGDMSNGAGNEQSSFMGLSFPKAKGNNSHPLVNNSDSNLYATIVKNKRRNSNASESNQSTISCSK